MAPTNLATFLSVFTSLSLFSGFTSTSPTPNSTLSSRQVVINYVNAIWRSDHVSDVDLGGGSTTSYDASFSLVDESGNVIYETGLPGGYAACQTTGHTFYLKGSCFGGSEYAFSCTSDITGNPEHCQVGGVDGERLLGEADGDTNDNFYGVYVTSNGYCGTRFPRALESGCTPDGDWSVRN